MSLELDFDCEADSINSQEEEEEDEISEEGYYENSDESDEFYHSDNECNRISDDELSNYKDESEDSFDYIENDSYSSDEDEEEDLMLMMFMTLMMFSLTSFTILMETILESRSQYFVTSPNNESVAEFQSRTAMARQHKRKSQEQSRTFD